MALKINFLDAQRILAGLIVKWLLIQEIERPKKLVDHLKAFISLQLLSIFEISAF